MRTGATRRTARALFAEPVATGMTVSPNGDAVSYVRHQRYADSLILHRLDDRRSFVVVTSGWPIGGHAWLPDGRAMVYVASDRRQARDRVFTIDVAARVRTEVAPFASAELTMLDAAEHRPGGPLFTSDDGGMPVLHRVSGSRPVLDTLDSDRIVSRWFLDPADRLCAGTRLDPDGTLHVFARRAAAWTRVAGLAPPDSLSTYPIDVTASGDRLVCIGPTGTGTAGLLAVDLRGGNIDTLVSDPVLDLDDVLLHPRTRVPRLLVFAGPRPVYRPQDGTAEAMLAAVRRETDGDPRVVARSPGDGTWIVRVDDAGSPPHYLVWRRSGGVEPLPPPYPRLGRRRFVRPEQITFPARDGTTLSGYLTRPPGPRLRPPPTVLLVHGGPWSRDGWEFVPEVQWLTARGYACLQVNFRGSEGAGTALLNAADRDWGGRPQDDLDAAAAWAVAAGEAASERIAVIGRSYGGYAALLAATARPRRFACVVAVSAPTDLVDFVTHVAGTRLPTRGVFLYRVGDPHRDRAHLRARSPLTHAADVHTPVLLAHGRLDPLVPFRQAERFRAALVVAGLPTRLLAFPHEGHGYLSAGSRVRLAIETARFLTAHLDRPGSWTTENP